MAQLFIVGVQRQSKGIVLAPRVSPARFTKNSRQASAPLRRAPFGVYLGPDRLQATTLTAPDN